MCWIERYIGLYFVLYHFLVECDLYLLIPIIGAQITITAVSRPKNTIIRIIVDV